MTVTLTLRYLSTPRFDHLLGCKSIADFKVLVSEVVPRIGTECTVPVVVELLRPFLANVLGIRELGGVFVGGFDEDAPPFIRWEIFTPPFETCSAHGFLSRPTRARNPMKRMT